MNQPWTLDTMPASLKAYTHGFNADQLLLLRAWACKNQFTPSRSHCAFRLNDTWCQQCHHTAAYGRGGAGSTLEPDCRPPACDHPSLWCRNGKAFAYVFQPYHLDGGTLAQLIAYTETHGWQFRVSTWPAWHYPGGVLFVEIRRHGDFSAPPYSTP